METIFRQLPGEIFKPLAAPNRQLYSRLLLYLFREVLGDLTGNLPSKKALIHEIGQYVEDWQRENPLQEDAEDNLAAQDNDQRRFSIYRRLLQTGWLIEHRDGYRQLVDFNAEARLLLQEIDRIESGQAQSYGGTVINVLSNLESAIENPSEKSVGIENAALKSKEFLQHIRTVAAAVRKMEEHIIRKKELRGVFEAYFDNYVEKHLIQDIKTLRAQNNPFRFKDKIVSLIYELYDDEVKMMQLGRSYVQEGRSPDSERAHGDLLRDLDKTRAVFENIDQNLRIIEDTNLRLQRRIANTVRYMDRIGFAAIDRITMAIRAVAAMPYGISEEIPVPGPVLPMLRPVGTQDFYQKSPSKTVIAPQLIRKREPDPALSAYDEAKRTFLKMVTPSPAHVEAFLEDVLGSSYAVDAENIKVETLEDFVIFQRLRELHCLYGGMFANRYVVEMKGGLYESDWIRCGNFTIRRATKQTQEWAA